MSRLIGQPENTATPEFSIYKMRTPYANKGEAYLVELDGVNIAAALTVTAAHKAIKAHCKDELIKLAGVTEVFGRNRQYITTNRYGFRPWKDTAS